MARLLATLMALPLAACGGDDDGGGGDPDGGGADAASVDAGPSTMTVTVLGGDGEVFAGAQVLFVDADGEVVADETTGADGVASAAMWPGGSLHVLREVNASIQSVSSFLDLWPDAAVVSQFKDLEKAREEVTISWPEVADADQYWVTIACYPDFDNGLRTTTTEETTVMEVDADCADDFDVLVVVQRAGGPRESLLATSVSGPEVEVTGTWTENVLLDVAFDDLPDTEELVHTSARSWFRRDTPNTAPLDALDLQPEGTAELNVSPLTNHAVDLSLDLGAGTMYYVERLPPDTTDHTRSLDGRLHSAVVTPMVDLAARTVTWTELEPTPTGAAPAHALVAQLRYANNDGAVIFTIVAPPSSTRPGEEDGTLVLDIPDVPGDHDFEPTGGELENFMTGGLFTIRVDEEAALGARGIAQFALNYDARFFDIPEVTYLSLSQGIIAESP